MYPSEFRDYIYSLKDSFKALAIQEETHCKVTWNQETGEVRVWFFWNDQLVIREFTNPNYILSMKECSLWMKQMQELVEDQIDPSNLLKSYVAANAGQSQK